MKRILIITIIISLISIIAIGCDYNENFELEKKVAQLDERVKVLEQEKRLDDLALGYEDIEEIEIKNFDYTAKKSFEDRNCISNISSSEREFLKRFMKIFDSRVFESDKEEVIPLEYQITLYRVGKEEKYEVYYDEDKAIFLSHEGVKYIVDSQYIMELKYLLENYYFSDSEGW